jgi:hypothetical protein
MKNTITQRKETLPSGKVVLIQVYGDREIRRYRANPNTDRPAGFLVSRKGAADGYFVPNGIAALAAGPDHWLRSLSAKCTCGRNFTVGDPEATNGEVCPECTAEAETENAALDNPAQFSLDRERNTQFPREIS